MGKTGSWFSAIKRVFTCNAKKKRPLGSVKKNANEKKKGRRVLRHGEIKSFLFREPSSIEKILGEVDQQNLFANPSISQQSGTSVKPTSSRTNSSGATSPRTSSNRATPPRFASPTAASPKVSSPRALSPTTASSPQSASPKTASPRAASPRATSPRAASPREASSREASPRAASPKATSPGKPSLVVTYPEESKNDKEISNANRPEPTLTLHLSATKIQGAYRRYLARRNFRSSRGFTRLQGVVRSSSVKRQTVNAMKKMQFLVRVQMQIKSRRTQMFENQTLQTQVYRNDTEVKSILSKWSQLIESGNVDNWDNSVLTKEEVDARRRQKMEASIKRERAMTYAYSHQLSKSNPKSAADIRASGIPWWWNWLDHQLPLGNDSDSQSTSRNTHQTPLRAISEYKPGPQHQNFKQLYLDFYNHESVTPRSTKSAIPLRGSIQMHTPRRTSPMSISSMANFSRRRASATAANSPFSHSLKDDDSLTSCPPFSGPNYMSPTISARAKFREKSNLEEKSTGTPSISSKRRLSFPSTPKSTGSSKWKRGSGKDADHDSMGDRMSVGSTVSTPPVVGKKPFKRFV